MLGSVDRSHVFRLVEALAQGDGKTVVETSEALRLHGLSAAAALEEMSMVLQRMAVLQAVPQGADHGDEEAVTIARLAALMPADETQLLYSICLHGRAELGLAQDRPVALVMGGGLGIGVEEATAAALQATHPAVQIVTICAKNEAARVRLLSLGVPPERLHVHGTVRGMERFLAATDVVAGKPGGLTVSETLAVGRPLLLTRPIPGAEEVNTRAVVEEGAGLCASTEQEMRPRSTRSPPTSMRF
jgi:UDP-N-acetylglucosamine:LPS N-acetylglucosamine transferase